MRLRRVLGRTDVPVRMWCPAIGPQKYVREELLELGTEALLVRRTTFHGCDASDHTLDLDEGCVIRALEPKDQLGTDTRLCRCGIARESW